MKEIGAIHAQLRDVHLQAHLDQVRILTTEQNILCSELLGYASPPENTAHQHRP